jgi:superfamily II DNA/RNA helicase
MGVTTNEVSVAVSEVFELVTAPSWTVDRFSDDETAARRRVDIATSGLSSEEAGKLQDLRAKRNLGSVRRWPQGANRCEPASHQGALSYRRLADVFNHDLPSLPEAYVHRTGRAGRNG